MYLCFKGQYYVGACIACNNSLQVVSLGYYKGRGKISEICDILKCFSTTEKVHTVLSALLSAKGSRVNLTKCSLYTTKPPYLDCTQAILQTGIRVVVYGDVEEQGLDKDVYDLVYQAKACFK